MVELVLRFDSVNIGKNMTARAPHLEDTTTKSHSLKDVQRTQQSRQRVPREPDFDQLLRYAEAGSILSRSFPLAGLKVFANRGSW